MRGFKRPVVNSPEHQQQLMEKVEKGHDAGIVEAMVRDVIDQQMFMCCQQLIALYRAGGIDHDMVIGKIGEMAGLQNLLASLETAQRLGTAALGRIENGEAQK